MKIIILLVLFIAVYGIIENTLILTVRREDFGGNIKAAHISDLHKRRFGRGDSRICRLLEKEAPDVIFITGDLVSRTEENFESEEKLLKRLCGIAPVYMIFGNHEQSLPENEQKLLLEMLGRTDVILLRNRTVRTVIKDRNISILGLESAYTVYKKNGGYRGLDKVSVGDIKNLIGDCPPNEDILLAHNPLFAEAYSQWGADITLSGHIHGGAVRIPFTDIGLLSPERKFFPKYSKGVYTLGKMKLGVSAGLGKLRLFDPPEIVIYRL